jgi:hypothetical protein
MNWSYNSVPLTAAGDYTTTEISGFAMPSIRGENIVIPMMPGRIYVDKYFDQQKIVLGITFFGTDPTDLETNIATLVAIFNKLTQASLECTYPDSGSVSGQAEVSDFQGPVYHGSTMAKATVTFLVTDPPLEAPS